jgi:hypothetical protein
MSSEQHHGKPVPISFLSTAPGRSRILETGLSSMQVGLLDEHAAGRHSVEKFIHQHYAHAYDADVRHFLPRLLVLHDDTELQAALGFRRARGNRLFLEQYLDVSIEVALSLHLGRYVPRHGLVEVGNLVTAHAGGARWLITALTAYLKGAGYDWAVFTAVPALRNAFTRLGVELVSLAPADPLRLAPEERAHWGSYYATEPVVMAASVHQSHDALQGKLLQGDNGKRWLSLWREAFDAGVEGSAVPAG